MAKKNILPTELNDADFDEYLNSVNNEIGKQ
jgi:hypothetical protein